MDYPNNDVANSPEHIAFRDRHKTIMPDYPASAPAPKARQPQWPKGWLPGDDARIVDLYGHFICEDDYDQQTNPVAEQARQDRAAINTFHAARRVQFLDSLAEHGIVRKAAAVVGISRETAYRARRRHPDFADMWDAALVLARPRSEEELSDRAHHGVPVPVFMRGEHIATWYKKDARYLLAHLARLDKAIAERPDAANNARGFDQKLAVMAGHEPFGKFGKSYHEDTAQQLCRKAAITAPGRAEYEDHVRAWAEEETANPDKVADLMSDALHFYDFWNEEGRKLLDSTIDNGLEPETVLDRTGSGPWADDADEVEPAEDAESDDNCDDEVQDTDPQDSVTCVNTPAKTITPRRKVKAETMASPLALSTGHGNADYRHAVTVPFDWGADGTAVERDGIDSPQQL